MTFRAISFGAGQGSTALVIAIADKLVVNGYDFGAIPVDKVTFSDTGSELEATYRHIDTMREYLGGRGIALDAVKANRRPLYEAIIDRASGRMKSGGAQIPFFLAPDGKANQTCTYDWKSVPLDRSVKRAAKAVGKRNDVEVLIGFTIDEWKRCRGPRKTWPSGWRFRYPMIEAKVDRGWAVDVCRAALGYAPPSSACVFCPHRPDVGPGGRSWIKANEPRSWERVVAVDAAVRCGYMGLKKRAFISKLLIPVDDALRAAQSQGEFWVDGSNGCDEGVCFT